MEYIYKCEKCNRQVDFDSECKHCFEEDLKKHTDMQVLSLIKDSGHRRTFESGAVRDMAEGKGRCDLLPPRGLLALAKHFENGAKKYGERNWEKGLPLNSFVDSGYRHLLLYMAGEKDEDHLVACAWNFLCALDTRERLGGEFE